VEAGEAFGLGSLNVMGLFERLKKGGDAPGDAEVERLTAELTAADWRLRKAAAEGLGALGARARPAVPALEEAIADEHGEVCVAASDALSKIRIASDRD